jgi:hypothetical protein
MQARTVVSSTILDQASGVEGGVAEVLHHNRAGRRVSPATTKRRAVCVLKAKAARPGWRADEGEMETRFTIGRFTADCMVTCEHAVHGQSRRGMTPHDQVS